MFRLAKGEQKFDYTAENWNYILEDHLKEAKQKPKKVLRQIQKAWSNLNKYVDNMTGKSGNKNNNPSLSGIKIRPMELDIDELSYFGVINLSREKTFTKHENVLSLIADFIKPTYLRAIEHKELGFGTLQGYV